jgi:hypothetical protein
MRVAPNVRQLPGSLRQKTCLLLVLLRGYQIFGASGPFNAIPGSSIVCVIRFVLTKARPGPEAIVCVTCRVFLGR